MKRVISTFLALMLILGSLPVFAAEGVDTVPSGANIAVAYITPESSSNIKFSKTVPPIETRNGKKAWKLEGLTKYVFDIADDFAYQIEDGSAFEFEIEYSSEGDTFFEWRYDAKEEPTYFGKLFLTGNSRKIEKQSVTVQNAYFDNELKILNDSAGPVDAGDFWLSTAEGASWFSRTLDRTTSVPVYIHSVKVTRYIARNPVVAFTEFKEAGNTFEWYRDDKIAYIDLNNTLDESITFELNCKGEDQYGHRVLDSKETVTLAAKEKKAYEIKIDTKLCGIYTFNVNIDYGTGRVASDFGPWQFAVVKTDENSIRDDFSYISVQSVHTADIIANGYAVDMVAKSNLAGIREGIPLDYVRSSADGTFHYAWGDGVKGAADSLKRHNLNVDLIVSFWSSDIPTASSAAETMITEKHSEKDIAPVAKQYLEHLKNIYGDNISYLEFWNEPKANKYKGEDVYLEDPVRFANAYMDISEITVPIARAVIPGVTVVSGDFGQPTRKEDYVLFDALFKNGVAELFDQLNIHTYSTTDGYEAGFASGQTLDFHKEIEKLSEKYLNGRKVKIAQTESGATRGRAVTATPYLQGSEDVQGNMFGRKMGYTMWNYYTLHDEGVNPETTESFFGVTSGHVRRQVTLDGDMLKPYDGFLQITANSYWLAKSEFVDMQKTEDGKYIFEFDSEKFNSKVVSFWKNGGEDSITFDLGVDSLIYSDAYGNETTVYSDDGVYTFNVDDRPAYICGDFRNVKLKDSPKFDIEYGRLDVAKGDKMKFEVTGNGLDGFTFMGETTGIMQPAEPAIFKNGKAIMEYKISDDFEGTNRIKLQILNDEKVYAVLDYCVTINEQIISEIAVKPKNDGNYNNWQLEFTIENLSQTNAIRGKIKVNGPEILNSMKEIDFGIIPKGKKAKVIADTPAITNKQVYAVDYNVAVENGETYNFTKPIDFTIAKKARGQIVVDGKMGEGEWDETTAMSVDTRAGVVRLDDWYGPKDLSGTTMIQWDEENLYFMSIVTDDMHRNVNSGERIWDGDNIQMGLFYVEDFFSTVDGDAVKRFNEIGMSLLQDGSTQCWKWSDQDNKLELVGELKNCEANAVRDESAKKTYYEFKISWKDLMGRDEVPISAGQTLGFSQVYNEDDGFGRKGWMEYASGIALRKDSTLFTYLTLID